jgi:mannitol/fructose-specific phosphotransferase system IIA component (Ntr-type)
LGELVTLVEDYEFVELIEKTSSPKEIIDFIKSKK